MILADLMQEVVEVSSEAKARLELEKMVMASLREGENAVQNVENTEQVESVKKAIKFFRSAIKKNFGKLGLGIVEDFLEYQTKSEMNLWPAGMHSFYQSVADDLSGQLKRKGISTDYESVIADILSSFTFKMERLISKVVSDTPSSNSSLPPKSGAVSRK